MKDMANRYTFKNKELYKNVSGQIVEDLYTTTFHHYLGNGSGTRLSPAGTSISASVSASVDMYRAAILASGRYKATVSFSTSGGNNMAGPRMYALLLGQGTKQTILANSTITSQDTNYGTCRVFCKDISFSDLTINSVTAYATRGFVIFNNCAFINTPVAGAGTNSNGWANISFQNNVFHFVPVSPMTGVSGRNTIIGGKGSLLNLTAQLYHKCNLSLTASNISGYANLYTAFNDCSFKIGEETDYVALNGTTPDELRADFVSRCLAQGIEVSNITEYGETLAQGRWLFTKKSVFENMPYKNSDIHRYELSRNIVFGFYGERYDAIAVSHEKDMPNTFIADNAVGKLVFSDRSLTLDESVDITDRLAFEATSKIVWLGGKRELTKSFVPNTFLKEYGILMDSTPNMDLTPIFPYQELIEEGEMYFVRSQDKQIAEISYNGTKYNTDVTATANRFRGVLGASLFETIKGNPVLYRLNDLLQYYTLQMRIVNRIPEPQIKTGNLTAGYWYLVEHDNDQTDTSGYITYNNVNYKVSDSFLVKEGILDFSVNGNIHLRRCWKNDFNLDNETVDKAFWTNEQKPKWFDVLPDDLRCIKRNNSVLSAEMQTDVNGEYITSGHPDFYNSLNGSYGYLIPAFRIRGVYVQFRLHITTQNPVNII